jgi:bacterial/archaeal transporter family-2 protein
MSVQTLPRQNLLPIAAAFGTGCLLTLMVHFNSELGRYGTPVFASWAAHGTGTVAAALWLAMSWFFHRRDASPATTGRPKAPLWAYLGGISGAITVIVTSITVNSQLALSGTLALGLAGQVAFGLAADRWGLFGMASRKSNLRDYAAVTLIVAGSAIIIFSAGWA